MGRETIDTVDSCRSNPTVRDPVWVREDVAFHETGELSDGTSVGRLGAKWYVINDDATPISRGYHEIRVTPSGLIGRIGAKQEPVVYPAEAQ